MVTARRLSEMDIPTRTDKRPTNLSPVTAAPAKASTETTTDFNDDEAGTDLFGMNSAGS